MTAIAKPLAEHIASIKARRITDTVQGAGEGGGFPTDGLIGRWRSDSLLSVQQGASFNNIEQGYLRHPDNPAVEPDDNGSFQVVFWLSRGTGGLSIESYAAKWSTSNNNRQYYIFNQNNSLRMQVSGDGTNTNISGVAISGVNDLAQGSGWKFCTAGLDDELNQLYCEIDRAPRNTVQPWSDGVHDGGTHFFNLGCRSGPNDQKARAVMDEVLFFKFPPGAPQGQLFASELNYLYNNGNGRNYQELIDDNPPFMQYLSAAWPLNEYSDGSARVDREDAHDNNVHLEDIQFTNFTSSDTGKVAGPPFAINSPIATWGDISGNDNTLSQATPSKQPSYLPDGGNGFPAVLGDGSDDLMQVAFPLKNQPITHFVAFRYLDLTGEAVITCGGATQRNTLYQNAGTEYRIFSGGSVLSGGTPDLNWHVMSAVFDGANNATQMWIDGVSVIGPLSSGTEGVDGISMFALPIEASHANVAVAERLVYDRKLSDAERQTVEAALAKYVP